MYSSNQAYHGVMETIPLFSYTESIMCTNTILLSTFTALNDFLSTCDAAELLKISKYMVLLTVQEPSPTTLKMNVSTSLFLMNQKLTQNGYVTPPLESSTSI